MFGVKSYTLPIPPPSNRIFAETTVVALVVAKNTSSVVLFPAPVRTSVQLNPAIVPVVVVVVVPDVSVAVNGDAFL